MPPDLQLDEELRAATFAYLDGLSARYGDALPWNELRSFTFHGQPVPLVGQSGITKPRMLDAALSFTTTYTPPSRRPPYLDAEGPDGLPRYKYRGDDPNFWDNRAMKAAEKRRLPLAWFVGVDTGYYAARYPVWLVGHDDTQLEFAVAVDDEQLALAGVSTGDAENRRRYVERLTRLRLHQPIFRAQVLRAYETKCAICRLRHPPLLDAAHIRPDALGGEPVVSNGIAMCKIHHSAYDVNLLGVRPDFVVEMKASVLDEIDGPMLRHGLQEVHGWRLELPRRRAELPNRDSLAQRYEAFLQAG